MRQTKFNLVRERWVNEGDYGYIQEFLIFQIIMNFQ
jgi:hypothetical protein